MEITEILKLEFFGNTVKAYAEAIGVFVSLVIIFRVFRNSLLTRLKRLALKTETKFDDHLVMVFEKIHPRFYDLSAAYIALHFINIPDEIRKVFYGIFATLLIIQAIVSLQIISEYVLHKILKDDKNKETDQNAFHAINLLIKIILWSSGLLLLLSNLGFNITSLAASLGIGGIAVALAVQNILGDILSSFSIYFDKPFEIGDFIIVGDSMGTVEEIGIKTTRLRALQGEELVISNKELTSAQIQNFKKMQKRRIVFSLGVTYDTSLEKCKQIPKILENIFTSMENVELDRATFFEFADFSLNYEIVYYHLSGEYRAYMQTRQELNFRIKEEFEKAGIDMAFPTQTVYLEKS